MKNYASVANLLHKSAFPFHLDQVTRSFCDINESFLGEKNKQTKKQKLIFDIRV